MTIFFLRNENLSMNLDQIKSKINKKTKAIIFVHFSGLTTNLTKLSKFCKRKKIFLIEDSAQSFGSNINNKFLWIEAKLFINF